MAYSPALPFTTVFWQRTWLWNKAMDQSKLESLVKLGISPSTHLIYLIVVNLEGEQFHITGHVSGFYVNRSSHNKFDPSPKPGPKTSSAHSLLTLLDQIDFRFSPAFTDILSHNSNWEPLAMFQLTNAIPSSPW